jgi:hypothetical protein
MIISDAAVRNRVSVLVLAFIIMGIGIIPIRACPVKANLT